MVVNEAARCYVDFDQKSGVKDKFVAHDADDGRDEKDYRGSALGCTDGQKCGQNAVLNANANNMKKQKQ